MLVRMMMSPDKDKDKKTEDNPSWYDRVKSNNNGQSPFSLLSGDNGAGSSIGGNQFVGSLLQGGDRPQFDTNSFGQGFFGNSNFFGSQDNSSVPLSALIGRSRKPTLL
ncbi:hypothetical protein [Geobacter pickeringii]|uniref:hypothetical protein n=1 Tax=Geobacter pickeringii TaxID=345632 RepID=UPI001F3B9B60|nr:hypothetical protein [Geobacter pickeringii]